MSEMLNAYVYPQCKSRYTAAEISEENMRKQAEPACLGRHELPSAVIYLSVLSLGIACCKLCLISCLLKTRKVESACLMCSKAF